MKLDTKDILKEKNIFMAQPEWIQQITIVAIMHCKTLWHLNPNFSLNSSWSSMNYLEFGSVELLHKRKKKDRHKVKDKEKRESHCCVFVAFHFHFFALKIKNSAATMEILFSSYLYLFIYLFFQGV